MNLSNRSSYYESIVLGLAFTLTTSLPASPSLSPARDKPKSGQAQNSELQTAETLIRARSFIKARKILDHLLQKEPDNYQARLDEAQLLRSMGLFARSHEDYEKLNQENPAAEKPLIALSEMALESLNPRQALKLARQAVGVAPSSLATHLCLVNALIATSAYHEAEGMLNDLRISHPDNAEVDYLLYKLALKQHQLSQARSWLERSLYLDPSNWQRFFELSELCKNMADYYGAKANLERVLTMDPTSVDALTKLAVIYEFNFHDYEQAARQYQLILSADPDSVTALAGIDRCKQKSNDLAGVMKDALWRFLRHSKTFPTTQLESPSD